MAIDPEKSARIIYNEALGSLMAHTIRGVVNHFRKHSLELDVWVIPDTYNVINLQAPKLGATSILLRRFFDSHGDGVTEIESARVEARIFIHPEANKHLARICIAHEIYHLLLEFDGFLQNERKDWPKITDSKPVEDSCNQFAWQLCKLHDDFNRKDDLRKTHIYFPDGCFAKVFKMDNISHYVHWPAGINLDPEHPFWKQ